MKKSNAMGGRFWLGIVLLLILLTGSLLAGFGMQALSRNVAQPLQLAAEKALSGDWNTSAELTRQAQKNWERRWKWTAAAADQTPMDAIDALFSQLPSVSPADDPNAFAACCYQLSALVQAVADAHQPTWWNFL